MHDALRAQGGIIGMGSEDWIFGRNGYVRDRK